MRIVYFLPIVGVVLFFGFSARAETSSIPDKKFPESAEPYIRPCYNKAKKYWDTGWEAKMQKGSLLYQECLNVQVQKLTKSYFSSENKQKIFLSNLKKIDGDYKKLFDDIYLENKWCTLHETEMSKCGSMDTMFSYGQVDSFYEKVLTAITETIRNKKQD